MMHAIESHIFKRTSVRWLPWSRGSLHKLSAPPIGYSHHSDWNTHREEQSWGLRKEIRSESLRPPSADYQTDLGERKSARQSDEPRFKAADHISSHRQLTPDGPWKQLGALDSTGLGAAPFRAKSIGHEYSWRGAKQAACGNRVRTSVLWGMFYYFAKTS